MLHLTTRRIFDIKEKQYKIIMQEIDLKKKYAQALLDEQREMAVQRIGLRDLEAAVAWTPASGLHDMLSNYFTHLKKQGEEPRSKPVGSEKEAFEIVTEMRRRMRGALEAGRAAKRGKDKAQSHVAAALGTNPEPSTSGEASTSTSEKKELVTRGFGGEATLNIIPPFIVKQGKIEMLTTVKTGEKGNWRYQCGFEGCGYPERPTGNQDSVQAHQRREHTDQVLHCPSKESCMNVYGKGPDSGSAFRTYNTQSMRHHFNTCVRKQKEIMAIQKILTEEVSEGVKTRTQKKEQPPKGATSSKKRDLEEAFGADPELDPKRVRARTWTPEQERPKGHAKAATPEKEAGYAKAATPEKEAGYAKADTPEPKSESSEDDEDKGQDFVTYPSESDEELFE